MRIMTAIGLLTALAFAGLSAPTRVAFSGEKAHVLTGSSDACTTDAVALRDWGRYPSVGFGAYVASGNGGSDSASFDVETQWSYDGSVWDCRLDTVGTAYRGVPGDSLATGYRFWIEEYYPRVSRFTRFIFRALSDNGDSVYIFPVFSLGDDGK